MTINIRITDKRPVVEGAPIIVCGNSGYSINFTFDAEWDAYSTKVVRFTWTAKGKVHIRDVEMRGTTCEVPPLTGARKVRVGVTAGDIRTTTPAAIPCELSILCEEGTPSTGNDKYYANEARKAADEAKAAVGEVGGYGAQVSALDKRVTNIESTLNGDLFITGDLGSVDSRTVPENALPYAEVKKIAGGITSSGGIISPKKPLRVESCKRAEKRMLDLTLDLSEMSHDMTVEKLADGSFKFNGYTSFPGSGYASCKFATVTLPKGNYGINYNVISGDEYPTITVNGNTISSYIDHMNGCFSIPEDNLTLNFYIDHDGTYGGLTDLVLSFEICEGTISGYEFVPAQVPFATLEIPEEIRNIDGYGLYDNYLDLEEKKVVIIRRVVNGALPPLPESEYIDVSQYLGDDNFIEVVPGGIMRVIQDTGEIMACKCEIVFMVKGGAN